MGWWQTDQFDWFTIYLRERGLQVRWRLAVFVFTVFLGAVPLLLLASPAGPDTALRRGFAIAAAGSAFAVSTLWLLRWPSRTQSLIYNVVCSGCIAAGCLVIPDPYGGLMGCTVFAAIGGFLAYFHALAHVLANFVVAMACAGITATRMFLDTSDGLLVAASFLLVIGLNIGVPFGIYSVVHTLRIDLRNSDRDALTGLLNRRSFYNAVHELVLAVQGSAGMRLNVTMVDLDDFKKLNDTKGHAVGDQALITVGVVLQENCGPDAVLGRLGGEEFVIADTATATDHAVTAERIRAGIAAMPFRITASLGTCSAAVPQDVWTTDPQFVDQLIQVADEAMYRSKRAGGDRSQHRHLDQAGAECP
ncbi:putative diguanylate cyclase DgcT [Mycolicibacterium vanbaalenii]|uniref:Putative diguanylate cyclase DgcT n=2 Tax=Mycolicibacterium vanbaalenii TaxID=110539 RepID=A0A5S9P3Y5_MYCVN|nr:putative diguanylate cyclase DgcT [Mycolicibacterium vanbaalenii]